MVNLLDKTQSKKDSISEKVANYLLVNGLHGCSLRPLAAALDTSDRMLLHYFKDKETLIATALEVIAKRLISYIQEDDTEPKVFTTVIPQLIEIISKQEIKPIFRIWIDLASLTAAGVQSYAAQTKAIAQAFHTWLAKLLIPSSETESQASLLMIIIDGCALSNALNLNNISNSALHGLQSLYNERSSTY
jgi:AcrR family transcriptional regulator